MTLTELPPTPDAIPPDIAASIVVDDLLEGAVDTAGFDDDERAKRIRRAVRAKSRQLRADHPILRHQSAIGAALLGVAAIGVLASGAAYATGHLAWWVSVPVAAFFLSIAHEIEHDTIHRQYFARNDRAQHVMFAVCWALRPYTVSPWARRPLHLLHHKVSGTKGDIEERGITNGEPWNLKRLVCMIDPLASVALRLPRTPEVRRFIVKAAARAYFPMAYVALAIWYSFLVLNLLHVDGVVVDAVNLLAVVWIAPNVLRVACLHFISSNMHYFGDVEEGNIVQQTQVLNRWFLAPLQLFCANFGSTHGIHHFVPSDPFYVRQLTARTAHEAMRDNGVRFNDLGTFRRANRYTR